MSIDRDTVPAQITPDQRMRKVLDEAAAIGQATARSLLFDVPELDRVR